MKTKQTKTEEPTGRPATDEEAICAWMEPKPQPNTDGSSFRSGKNWWYWTGFSWQPHALTLYALWEVEERLTMEQWKPYVEQLLRWQSLDQIYVEQLFWLVHATADKKIQVLAQVLREAAPTVPNKKGECA